MLSAQAAHKAAREEREERLQKEEQERQERRQESLGVGRMEFLRVLAKAEVTSDIDS